MSAQPPDKLNVWGFNLMHYFFRQGGSNRLDLKKQNSNGLGHFCPQLKF